MSRRAAYCDGCGARIVFATTRNAKWVPILATFADRLERLSGGALAYRRGAAPTHFKWQCDAELAERRRNAKPASYLPDPVEAALAVLGLRRGAPPVVIAAAWRALSRVHHPDVGGDGRRMAEINAARDVLAAAGLLDDEVAA